MIYPLAKSVLFRLDPERAHAVALASLKASAKIPPIRAALNALFTPAELEPIELLGLVFPNRVGLAAGYDKDGDGWRGLANLGFGHIEIGTVTPEPQPGNARPRVFRLADHDSLINRMGFPGVGAKKVARRLKGKRPNDVVLGVNIGKQKTTPLEKAADDYRHLVNVFAPLADYLTVNISSPNTPGLRQLQEPAFLGALLSAVLERRDEVVADGPAVPVLVKLAPDLDDEQLRSAVDVILEVGMDGIIATNTTIGRDGVSGSAAEETGGLSGAALTDLSTRIISRIHEHSGGALPIIGVGGILSADDARAKIEAGASLVQIYTGLIYRGPALVAEVARAIHGGERAVPEGHAR